MRAALIVAGLMVAASPLVAQEVPPTAGERALIAQFEAVESRNVVLDAFLICPIMLVRDPEAEQRNLEGDGWSMSLWYQTDADPFFSEYEGAKTYDDGRTGTFYVGVEDYEGLTLSYCAFTLEGGDVSDVPVNLATKMFPGARFERVDSSESYAVWTLELDKSFHARAEQLGDVLYVQYTLITQH